MDYKFNQVNSDEIADAELTELLTEVYVDGGFTDAELAKTLFQASAVRERGVLIGIRETNSTELAGVIILVPPNSKACRLAKDNEAEMHLLGVKPKYRGQGLGKRLILQTIKKAKSEGYDRMVLWTQESMITAQKLYESLGFLQVSDLEKNGRKFFVYALTF